VGLSFNTHPSFSRGATVRRNLNIIVANILVFAFVSTSSAQSPSTEFSGVSFRGIPHPVSAALAYWDSLGLSDAQITQLRETSDQFENTMFSAIAATALDTANLWILWKREPIDSVTLVSEARTRIESEVAVTLAMLRARDAVFKVLTSAQAARLQTLVRNQLLPRSPTSDARHCPTRGGSGGSMAISDRIELVHSLSFEGDSIYIDALFVARADDKLHGSLRPVEQPVVDGKPLQFSGATSGRWWLQYDRRERVAWLHDQRINLGKRNVILVQGTDRLNRRPEVVGFATVTSPIVKGNCGTRELAELIKHHIMQVPAIRAFVTGEK
jgi:Spy/CpxP family protein refolding chaperone